MQLQAAEVTLDDPQDVMFFEKFFDNTEFHHPSGNSVIRVKSLQSSVLHNQSTTFAAQEEICVKVKWFQWQSRGRAIIKFKYPLIE